MEGRPFLRVVSERDAPQLLEIYAPYAAQTAVSFEYEVPTLDEFSARIAATLERYPYIAAEQDGTLLGYAYAGVFKARAAYDHAVELTVYLRRDARRQGLGRRLYTALEALLRAQNVTNAYACIGYPRTPDARLPLDSPAFHEKLGYRTVGRFSRCGYKFDQWYDMIWMEKVIGSYQTPASPLIPFPDLPPETVQDALAVLS